MFPLIEAQCFTPSQRWAIMTQPPVQVAVAASTRAHQADLPEHPEAHAVMAYEAYGAARDLGFLTFDPA
jgi:hypothetical protein